MPSYLRLCVVPLVLAIVACNTDETSSSVRHDYLQRHRDNFVFDAPRAKIVDALDGLLAERGIELTDRTGASYPLHTKRHADGDKSLPNEEFVIHLIKLQRGGHLVHVLSIARDATGAITSSTRQDDLEWELIQRVEPDRSVEITDQANRRADAVAPRAKATH